MNTDSLLRSRYYRQGETSWGDVVNRVVHHLYGSEWSDAAHWAMMNKTFLPSSPVLMNAGARNPMMCSCFVLPVEDDIRAIMDCLHDTVMIQKWGGGVGINFSPIRADGSHIMGTGGRASGPVSFMGFWNTGMNVIRQGGKRQGAMMGVLNWDHPDLDLFLGAKAVEGELTNFNLSVGIDEHTPESVIDKIASRAWHNGEPGVLFLDNINKNNPYGTPIVATNPCGEVPLPPYGACCLGSLNLKNFLQGGEDGYYTFDYLALFAAAKLAAEILNRVLDTTWWPVRAVAEFENKWRPIGIGVLGLADALIRLGIPYGSKAGRDIASQIMTTIELGAKKGSRDNATLMAIAPTGSITMLAGSSSYSIEPLFALKVTKNVELGSFEESSMRSVEILARRFGYNLLDSDRNIINETGSAYMTAMPKEMKNVLRTALEISPMEHLLMQHTVQQVVDNSVSKTINLPFTTTKEDIAYIIRKAHEFGLKGLTLYRSGSRELEVMDCPSGKCEL